MPNVNIYVPFGWYTVVQMASKKGLYEVKEISNKYFYDFVYVLKNVIQNKNII